MKDAFIGLVVLAGIVLLIVKVGVVMPDHASVALNPSARTYAAGDCVSPEEWRSAKITTKGAAEALGFKADRGCVNKGGFVRDTRLLAYLLGMRPNWE